MTVDTLVNIFISGSIAGFLFLSGWCWYLNSKMSSALLVADQVGDIHKALMGTMKDEGLISKMRRIEERCDERHKQ